MAKEIGIGPALFLMSTKAFAWFFLVLTIINIPVFMLYHARSQYAEPDYYNYYEDEAFLDTLVLGSIGTKGFLRAVSFPDNDSGFLYCKKGTLGPMISYGMVPNSDMNTETLENKNPFAIFDKNCVNGVDGKTPVTNLEGPPSNDYDYYDSNKRVLSHDESYDYYGYYGDYGYYGGDSQYNYYDTSEAMLTCFETLQYDTPINNWFELDYACNCMKKDMCIINLDYKDSLWEFDTICPSKEEATWTVVAQCIVEDTYNPLNGKKIQRETLGMIIVVVDMLVGIFFVIFIKFMEVSQKRYVAKYKEEAIEMDDFTVRVQNLPNNHMYANDPEILKAYLA